MGTPIKKKESFEISGWKNNEENPFELFYKWNKQLLIAFYCNFIFLNYYLFINILKKGRIFIFLIFIDL